jgi:hypothetical protein
MPNEVNDVVRLLGQSNCITPDVRDDLYIIAFILRNNPLVRIMRATSKPLAQQLRIFRKTFYTRESLIKDFGSETRGEIVFKMLNGLENVDTWESKKENLKNKITRYHAKYPEQKAKSQAKLVALRERYDANKK